MEFKDLGMQIAIVCALIVFLWAPLKAFKVAWKLVLVFLIFIGLSFALPAVRELIFSFF